MSAYPGPSSINPYWYYDPHGYQPNVSVSFNTNISGLFSNENKYFIICFFALLLVNTPPHPSFDMYNNNNSSSRFADSGYLSRTPTPPTPIRNHSPQPMPMRQELDTNGIYLN
jgi:hypothetical protein